jgi:pimeloyl-ACP methyl ester carboxylesterase
MGDGRVGLIGHSLGAEAVIRYAVRNPGISSAVALAPGTDTAIAGRGFPTDLLVLAGAQDAATRPVAERIAVQLGEGDGRTGVSHHDAVSGGAWRVEIVPDVGHMGILFSGRAIARSSGWLAAELAPARGPVPGDDPGPDAPAQDPTLPRLLAVYAGAGGLLVLLLARLPIRRRSARRITRTDVANAPASSSAGEAARSVRWLGHPSWWLAAAGPAIAGAVAAAALPAERYLPVAVAGRRLGTPRPQRAPAPPGRDG